LGSRYGFVKRWAPWYGSSKVKIATIARFEFVTTLQRRSVLFIIFGMPVIMLLLLLGANWLVRSAAGTAAEADGPGPAAAFLQEFAFGGEDQRQALPAGLVDQTGRITEYPAPAGGSFRPLADEASARAAFEADEIRGYYVIPPDYLATGEVFYYARTMSLDDTTRQTLLVQLLATNFLEEAGLVEVVTRPPAVHQVNLSPAVTEPFVFEPSAIFVAFGVAMLFYMTAIGAAGYLLQSLGKEKQNRVMEILLGSTRPFDLLVGKLVGLGAIGLLQMAVWSGLALLVFGRGAGWLANISLPALGAFAWLLIVLHFLTGYLVYGALFAGLGAVSPGAKESSQYTFFFMLPTFLPLWFSSALFMAPNGRLAVAMSLIPFTSPVAMPMRLVATAVPAWQWSLSLALGLATAVLTLWLATRVFRSQALLSGQPPTPRALWAMLRRP
jgi:ABC-2 type transport system permease protein